MNLGGEHLNLKTILKICVYLAMGLIFLDCTQSKKGSDQSDIVSPKNGCMVSAASHFKPDLRKNVKINRKKAQKEFSDLTVLLKSARALPALNSKGESEGFKFLSIEKGSYFNKLGIKENDVVLAVNNVALDSPRKAVEVYEHIKKNPAEKYTACVLRDKKTVEITWKVK